MGQIKCSRSVPTFKGQKVGVKDYGNQLLVTTLKCNRRINKLIYPFVKWPIRQCTKPAINCPRSRQGFSAISYCVNKIGAFIQFLLASLCYILCHTLSLKQNSHCKKMEVLYLNKLSKLDYLV